MSKFGKYDKNESIAYACGVFPAMELLNRRPACIRALLVRPESTRNEGARSLIQRCRQDGIYVEEAPKAIARISGKENCYAVAVFEKFSDVLNADRPHVVLHNIADMGTFGTIVRTCLGFGFDDIALIRPCVDAFDPKAVRASMGALFSVRLAFFDSFEAYAQAYRAHTPYFFRLRNAQDLYDTVPDGLVSLVFGNESSGLPDTLCQTGNGVRIRHSDRIDSLNLSIAVGVGTAYFSRMLGL